jgi:hypothetical protein
MDSKDGSRSQRASIVPIPEEDIHSIVADNFSEVSLDIQDKRSEEEFDQVSKEGSPPRRTSVVLVPDDGSHPRRTSIVLLPDDGSHRRASIVLRPSEDGSHTRRASIVLDGSHARRASILLIPEDDRHSVVLDNGKINLDTQEKPSKEEFVQDDHNVGGPFIYTMHTILITNTSRFLCKISEKEAGSAQSGSFLLAHLQW